MNLFRSTVFMVEPAGNSERGIYISHTPTTVGYSRGESVSVSSVESCLNFTSALEAVISKPPSSSSLSSLPTSTTGTRSAAAVVV